MKMSLSQMIAIVCILSSGFMIVTPFVPTVDADPFEVTIIYRDVYVCEDCGSEIWTSVRFTGPGSANHDFVWNHAGLEFRAFADTEIECGTCDECSSSSS